MNAEAYITLAAIDTQNSRSQFDYAASGQRLMLSWTMSQEAQTSKMLHSPRGARICSLRVPH